MRRYQSIQRAIVTYKLTGGDTVTQVLSRKKWVPRYTYDHKAIQRYVSTHGYKPIREVALIFGCSKATVYRIRGRYMRNKTQRMRKNQAIRAFVYGTQRASVHDAAQHFGVSDSCIYYHIRRWHTLVSTQPHVH